MRPRAEANISHPQGVAHGGGVAFAQGAVAFAPLTPSDCLFNPTASPSSSPSKHASYASPAKGVSVTPSKGSLKGVPAFVTSAARPVTTHHQLGSLRMVERLSPPRHVRRALHQCLALRARRTAHFARAIPPPTPPRPAQLPAARTHAGHDRWRYQSCIYLSIYLRARRRSGCAAGASS